MWLTMVGRYNEIALNRFVVDIILIISKYTYLFDNSDCKIISNVLGKFADCVKNAP